jgi:hypothetical protein
VIHDLDDTLKDLLVREAGIDPTVIDIRFEMPSPEWSTEISSRPTINLYLYDVRENVELRSSQSHATRVDDAWTQRRAPVRVDLSYMISVWTEHIADEHQLLGQILLTLLRHPLLPPHVLKGSLLTQPLPLRAWIAQPERIPNSWDFWGHVEHRMKSGLSYVVTASLEPHAVQPAPPVRRREIQVDHLSLSQAESRNFSGILSRTQRKER